MKVSVFGIGNYSDVIIELCTEVGYEIEALYHYNSNRDGELVDDFKIEGDYQFFLNKFSEVKNKKVVVAIGDNQLRNQWLNFFRERGYDTINLIHPSAYISPSVIIGSGTYIHAKSFVWTKSIIGNNVIISPNAMVAHHCKIFDGVLVSANSTIGSYVTLQKNVMVGINAGIISKPITIGENSIIGANAMVIQSFAAESTIIGTPGIRINK